MAKNQNNNVAPATQKTEPEAKKDAYKKSVRTSNNLYGLYGVQKSEIQTITRLNSLQFAVRVRTSTDRTGCTNFFREKMHFLRAGVDKRLDAHEK